MSKQQPEQRDLAPRPNPILAEPATPENCAADYAQGADVRDRMDQQDRRERR
ncbi:MAG: hypothetical protein HOV82_10195 [Streptomyces sp.]|nr:hypothetical protein [Streptomyces sp.]